VAEVGQHLRMVDCDEPIDGLDLDDDAFLYQEIEPVDGAEWLFLVRERHDKLPRY
jgi:hypothetical protein